MEWYKKSEFLFLLFSFLVFGLHSSQNNQFQQSFNQPQMMQPGSSFNPGGSVYQPFQQSQLGGTLNQSGYQSQSSFQQPQMMQRGSVYQPSQQYFSRPQQPLNVQSMLPQQPQQSAMVQQGVGAGPYMQQRQQQRQSVVIGPEVFLGMLKKNFFANDVFGQQAVDYLIQNDQRFRTLFFQSLPSLNLLSLKKYVESYRVYMQSQVQPPVSSVEQKKVEAPSFLVGGDKKSGGEAFSSEDEDEFFSEEENERVTEDEDEYEYGSELENVLSEDIFSDEEVYEVEKKKIPPKLPPRIKRLSQKDEKRLSGEKEKTQEAVKSETLLTFPHTWIVDKKEYSFSPVLHSKTGLPKGMNKEKISGDLYYVSGTETFQSFPRVRPKWRKISGVLEQINKQWSVAPGRKSKTLRKMPPIFSSDGKGIARPYLFYNIMGVMEQSFIEQTKGEKDFSRFPILQEIKNNFASTGGLLQPGASQSGSSFEKLLKLFPFRAALFDSQFYLVKASEDLKTVNKSGGSLDFDTYHASRRYSHYKKLGMDTEEARRLAIRDVDIRYLQERHPGAAFMIASNIDCLEGGMEHEPLESMQYGAVQGENASLAAMGASIIRKYCIDKKDRMLLSFSKSKYKKNGTMGRSDWWEIKGSRIIPKEKAFSIEVADLQKMPELVCVGVHKNVAVTSGYYDSVASSFSHDVQKKAGKKYGDWFKENSIINANRWKSQNAYNFSVYNGLVAFPYPRVHQIFAAAYDLKRSDKNIDQNSKELFAYNLLYAMYRGTIIAAANLNVKELFLTCLGCGAFGNKADWVREILNSKDIQDLIKNSGMKVYMVGYKAPHELN